MNPLPVFFNDEGTDSGYEAIQDFFLSWTLRCSADVYKESFKVNLYSKKVLYSLLYGQNRKLTLKVDFRSFETFKVVEIKTHRQFKGIDLLAEIKVLVGDKAESYILNIENKYYSSIRNNQLENYVQKINDVFDLRKNKLVNVVIFCDDCKLTKGSREVEECIKHQYKFTHIPELATLAQMDDLTGNHLFDEFWFNWS